MRRWRRCRDWLLPALEDGTEQDLLADLSAGRAQLWLDEEAAMVTQVVEEDAGRILHVWLAGGALKGVLRLKPQAEDWARKIGCAEVTLIGRPGWIRVLRADGFMPVGDELRKRL